MCESTAAQNIYAVCASNNLLTATQGMFPKKALRDEIDLPGYIDLVLMVSFGYQQ